MRQPCINDLLIVWLRATENGDHCYPVSSRGWGNDCCLVCPYVYVLWLHVKALQAAACKGKRQKHSPELQDLPVGERDVVTEIIKLTWLLPSVFMCLYVQYSVHL